MISVDLMQRRGQNPFAARNSAGDWSGVSISGQYSEAYRRTDLERWARLYHVPYREPVEQKMDARRRTLYCVAAELARHAKTYCRLMFDAMYVSGVAVDENDCLRFAQSSGLAPDQLRHSIESGKAAKHHDEIVVLALSAGAFGVPTFVCEGELFWGNDRLVLLRDYLLR